MSVELQCQYSAGDTDFCRSGGWCWAYEAGAPKCPVTFTLQHNHDSEGVYANCPACKTIIVTLNDFDIDHNACAICGKKGDHGYLPHALATKDGLTRMDIIEYLDGRGFRPEWYQKRLEKWQQSR